jgi:two-component system chemotaxis response regulator CheB
MSKFVGPWAGPPIRTFLVGQLLVPLEQILVTSSDIEICGTAMNGKEALERIPRIKPQVICTELEMPVMDGLDLTRGIMATDPRPILVMSRFGEQEDREKTVQLFEAGALEVFPMPDYESNHVFPASAQALINKIKILSGVMVLRRRQILPPMAMKPYDDLLGEFFQTVQRLVLIGASTGGPQALKEILGHLPAEFPLPIVCVQHMSQGFLQGLVDWLAVDCVLPIAIAQTEERPHAGTVYFPPEGRHLKFDADGRFLVTDGPKVDDHLPSVTVAFQSAAYRFGHQVIGVLLTGMGQDGVDGMLAIAEQGGVTIAQNEESCVVFGMPHRAIEVKAVSHILPLQDIASMLISTVVR